MRTPEGVLRAGGSLFRQVLIPTTVAVLTDGKPDGDVVLVDAGFSREEIESPRKLGIPHGLITHMVGTGADAVCSQLARLDIAADRVKAIVATHLHMDHVGAFVDFPNAEIIAPAAEFADARARGSLAGYIHINGILRSGRARPIRFEGGWERGFPRHTDLFGDGRVVLLDARGHTAGSVCVLLTDPEDDRSVLMAGDTAYTPAEYRLARFSRLMKSVGWDFDRVRATWGALLEFEDTWPEIPVVLSHDPEVFDRLVHA